tara:strand:+ start:429 stop:1121 length:693 start_codon:yes stop_codon:yes gene_type:complete
MAYKMKGFSGFKNSPAKQKVDPDAPGTPGTPGYEPPVKRSDLDAKGKAIWDAHRAKNRPQPTYEGTDEYRKEKDIPKKEFKKRGVKSPAKQKNKGKMQGPIPEQNIKLQPDENEGTWIYGRGYKGEDPKKGVKEMKATEKRLNKNKKIKPGSGTDFVKSERIIDYDQRAGSIEQNELQEDDSYLGGAKKSDSFIVKRKAAKKGAKKRKSLKKTVKTLDREAQIMRDRTSK